MKKVDLKKLALMGIASGALIATQSAQAAQSNSGSNSFDGIYLASAKCGGGNGCGGHDASDDDDDDDDDDSDDDDNDDSDDDDVEGGDENSGDSAANGSDELSRSEPKVDYYYQPRKATAGRTYYRGSSDRVQAYRVRPSGEQQRSSGSYSNRPRHWTMSNGQTNRSNGGSNR